MQLICRTHASLRTRATSDADRLTKMEQQTVSDNAGGRKEYV